MIRHLLALTWQRRWTNLLLMVEIFVAFLVLVTVTIVGVYFVPRFGQPLGYVVDDVWRVSLDRRGENVDPELPRRLLAAVAALPPVVAVAGMNRSPYDGVRESTINRHEFGHVTATDSLPAVLGIELVRGRWFGREDDGASHRPVVVNEALARAHFGGTDPIGERLEEDAGPNEKTPVPMRVVGVIHDYRSGDLKDPGPEEFLFHRWQVVEIPRHLMVKMRPGTTAAFEVTLTKAITGVARDLSVEITTLDDVRRRKVRQALIMLGPIPVLAAFLIGMVALGLSGVVWQNVIQRTPEIGLRRASGATAADIRRQLLGELVAMASLAIAAGGVLLLNFATVIAPLSYFDLANLGVTPEVYLTAFVLSAAAMYALVIAAGFFPTRMATRIQPLEALRYE